MKYSIESLITSATDHGMPGQVRNLFQGRFDTQNPALRYVHAFRINEFHIRNSHKTEN